MKKYICYTVALLSLTMLGGCHTFGVVVPHNVVYTSHTRTYVHRPGVRHRRVHVRRRAIRPRKRIIRNRYVRRQNVYNNRTVIHRHYYNGNIGKKNRSRGKRGKGKKGKRR